MKKIAVFALGVSDLIAKTHRIDWFDLSQLDGRQSIADYDVVVIAFPELARRNLIGGSAFAATFNPETVRKAMRGGARIILAGDMHRVANLAGVEVIPTFWTGLELEWNIEAGDRVTKLKREPIQGLDEYMSHVTEWSCSLERCCVRPETIQAWDHNFGRTGRGSRFEGIWTTHYRNKHGGAIASTILFVLQELQYGGVGLPENWKTTHSFGDVVILPRVGTDSIEMAQLVLRTLCGVDPCRPEPAWVVSTLAPGQTSTDEQIRQTERQIEKLTRHLGTLREERSLTRRCLELLHEMNTPLEKVVRWVLRELGLDVKDPVEPNKEDGWVSFATKEGLILHGVLEIKGTANPQFTAKGLGQLAQWVSNGIDADQTDYKGIFIGNSSVDTPPEKREHPFPDNIQKNIKTRRYVALTSVDLYALYVRHIDGLFDPNDFWPKVFACHGVFDVQEYLSNCKR